MAKKKVVKKEVKKPVVNKVPDCDKSKIDDPHHGEAGDYDANCNWIPSV